MTGAVAGNLIEVTPRVLLVPPDVLQTAEELIHSASRPDASIAGVTTMSWVSSLAPVTSSRLTNTTAWYLWADPNVTPTFEMVFFRGIDRPTVKRLQTDDTNTALRISAYIDFACVLTDWHGATRSPGT